MKGNTMLDSINTNDVMGTSTHILPETHVHKNLFDLSLFDFDVKEVPLHYYFKNNDGVEIQHTAPKKKAIIRSDTGEFIGNHSERYKTVPHYSLYKKHAEKVQEVMPSANLEIIDQSWDNGAKARRTIHFLDHSTTVRDGDVVNLRSDIFNSLDGAWAFQTYTGAYRSLCLNTLVFGGQSMYQEKRKHTGGLSISGALGKVSNSLDVFANQSEKFKLWSNIKLEDKTVANMLGNTLCHKKSKTIELQDTETGAIDLRNINTRLSDYLLYRYEQEQGKLGKTLWALYNAVTHWSTHTDESYEKVNDKGNVVEIAMGRKGSSKANVQKEREIAVRDMLDSRYWQELEVA